MWHLIVNVFILIPKFSSLGVLCSFSLWHVKTPSLQWSCSLSSYRASRFCKALSSQINLFPKRTRYLLKAVNNRTHEGMEKCSHRIECYVDNSYWISENYSWHNYMFCFWSKQDACLLWEFRVLTKIFINDWCAHRSIWTGTVHQPLLCRRIRHGEGGLSIFGGLQGKLW